MQTLNAICTIYTYPHTQEDTINFSNSHMFGQRNVLHTSLYSEIGRDTRRFGKEEQEEGEGESCYERC